MNHSIDTTASLTVTERGAFRWKAMQCLSNIDYGFKGTGVGNQQFQHESKALIMALQAFDLINATGTDGMTQAEIDNYLIWVRETKWRLQHWTRDIYRQATNLMPWNYGELRRDNNRALMTAAALGMAAVVLNDCGHRWWKPNWHPRTWANTANYVIQETMLHAWRGAMTNDDGTAGYAEGPHYFEYAFENVLPFFLTYQNFLPGSREIDYSYSVLGAQKNTVRSYLYNPRYRNLMRWFAGIIMPNNWLAPFDATFYKESVGFMLSCYYDASTRTYPFNWFKGGDEGGGTRLDIDFLALAPEPPQPLSSEPKDYTIREAGVGVLQNKQLDAPKDERIFLLMLGERGEANNGRGHEHKDQSSFIVSAGQHQLIIDPGYLGYGDDELSLSLPDEVEAVNDGTHHNLITFSSPGDNDFEGPEDSDEATVLGPFTKEGGGNPVEIKCTINYQGCDVTRSITSYTFDNLYYYVIQDEASCDDNKDIAWNINGNGNANEGTFESHFANGFDEWFDYKHPCEKLDAGMVPWNIRCAVATMGATGFRTPKTEPSVSSNGTVHCNDKVGMQQPPEDSWVTDYYSCGEGDNKVCSSEGHGFHTRVSYGKYNTDKAKFIAVLAPYRCGNPPSMQVIQEYPFACIRVNGLYTDGAKHSAFHSSYKLADGPATLTDPFLDSMGIAGDLEFEAERANYLISEDPKLKDGYCNAYTHFRSLSMDSGKMIKFQDTTYVLSPEAVSASFAIVGKCRYSAWVNHSNPSSVDVKFYLPDTVLGGIFVARTREGDLLPTVWDSTNRSIIVTCSPGNSWFYIELSNPCVLSCFFPPTATTIDSVFNFNNGRVEYLGHDLSVEQDSGQLDISNGSVMQICKDHYLVNKDSITMQGYSHKDFMGVRHDTCGGDTYSAFPFFTNSSRLSTTRSLIIVNDKAALVLEGGSRTHVGNNASIIVKSGGTLYIQNGALLEIGGPGTWGYGEVILEAGAYYCIEPGAEVRFYKNGSDSSDKNVFYIPSGFRGEQANLGKNSNGGGGIFGPSGPYGAGATCLPVCSLKNNDIVANPEYGWFNGGTPFAYIDAPDTLCLDDTMAIHSRFSLNESWFRFRICPYDTLAEECMEPYTDLNTCDTGRADFCNLADKMPWEADRTYKVTLEVYNQCGQMDDTFKIIHVKRVPIVNLTVPDSACPGICTFTADGSSSDRGRQHRWIVTPMEEGPAPDMPEDEMPDEPAEDSVYTYTGNVTGNFCFPGYRFKGGRKYIITLVVDDYCGTVSASDTINIPLGANILNDTPLVTFAPGLGLDSLWLNGRVTGTDSFQWLQKSSGGSFSAIPGADSTSLKVTPTQGTWYVLRAWSGNCSESDTVFVKVNMYAYAGRDTVICRGDSAWIGTSTASLPNGYTSVWRTAYHVLDSTSTHTQSGPDSTVTYTLYVYDNLGGLEETDEVTVYVDSLPSVAFGVVQFHPAYRFCMDNMSFPYSPATTYLWTFGDGDSSTEANPCHTFPYTGTDTFYWVCLTVSNACGDSTLCDSLFMPGDSSLLTGAPMFTGRKLFERPEPVVQDAPIAQSAIQTVIMRVAPNPTTGNTRITYRLLDNSADAVLLMYDLNGKQVGKYRVQPGENVLDVDLHHLPSGMYYTFIQTASSRSNGVKVVITR